MSGAVVVVIMWYLDLQLSVSITLVVSSDPADCEMYSIQHYVIKLVSGSPVSATNKTDHHNITETLLKVALNTITLTPPKLCHVPYIGFYRK